jgi:hypothetical protein
MWKGYHPPRIAAMVKLLGICLVTNNVPALADFYAKVLGVKAEGDLA